MSISEKALEMHEKWNGKIETTAKSHVNSREDLAIAYTPGVAEPCKVIAKDKEAAYKYTIKANTIAVVSDGSAVLGLGNIGAHAAMPVMEGKAVLFKEFGLLAGFGCILLAVFAGNAIRAAVEGVPVSTYIRFGFAGQPIAHTEWLWNLLGMTVVGWGCTLLGGCPLRQLILTGEGNSDSAITVLGMISGAAAAHTLKTASSADGTGANGPIATIVCLAVILIISVTHLKKEQA